MMVCLAGVTLLVAIYRLDSPSPSPGKDPTADSKPKAAVVPESHLMKLDVTLKSPEASQPKKAVISEAEKQRMFEEGRVALIKYRQLHAQLIALREDTDEIVAAVERWSQKFSGKAQKLTEALTRADLEYETAHENEELWLKQHEARAPQAMWDWLHSDERVGDLPIPDILVAVMDHEEFRQSMLRYVSGSSAYKKTFEGVDSTEAFLSALEKTLAASQKEYAGVSQTLPEGLRTAYQAQSDESFASQIKHWYNSCLTKDQVAVISDMDAQLQQFKRSFSALPTDTPERSVLTEEWLSLFSPSSTPGQRPTHTEL
jgi:hypothetical protein